MKTRLKTRWHGTAPVHGEGGSVVHIVCQVGDDPTNWETQATFPAHRVEEAAFAEAMESAQGAL